MIQEGDGNDFVTSTHNILSGLHDESREPTLISNQDNLLQQKHGVSLFNLNSDKYIAIQEQQALL